MCIIVYPENLIRCRNVPSIPGNRILRGWWSHVQVVFLVSILEGNSQLSESALWQDPCNPLDCEVVDILAVSTPVGSHLNVGFVLERFDCYPFRATLRVFQRFTQIDFLEGTVRRSTK